jgi:EAL domain-containing protein (putative c-di-GMP-specific phosphodiesterase class I)
MGETTTPDHHAAQPEETSLAVPARALMQRLLRAARDHLDLDVAFIGQFIGDERILRYVDSKPTTSSPAVHDSHPKDESYCGLIAAGQLPEFLSDASQHPATADLAVTEDLDIGSYLGVPITFSDGRIYGTFCCYAHGVKASLRPHDVQVLRMMAEVAGEYLEEIDRIDAEQEQRRHVIGAVLEDPAAMVMVFQPLRSLQTMQVVGLEALARFPGHEFGPEWFFHEAAKVGLGRAMEMKAVQLAITSLDRIPAPIRLNVNVSVDTLCSEDFLDLVAPTPQGRLVVEITEHAAVDDYSPTKRASARLTELGIWLAIDDVGMGFAGLHRILESAPEELKLDQVVIRDVDSVPVKQALISSFCSFGHRMAFGVVAEGIETEMELTTLRALGATIGQGYHLGRPDHLEAALASL